MSANPKIFLASFVMFLAAGTLVGWYYGHWEYGLLAAALTALVWHIRQLLNFERALRTGDFDKFRVGEGIWERIFSRFQFEQSRANRRKKEYRGLLKEVQKSARALPDGAVILDGNNEIIACNRAAKTLAGLKRRKDRGQRVDNILRDPKLTEIVNSGNYDRSIEIASPIRDGDWLSCRVVPYGAEQKLLLLRDVTERNRMAKARRDFVANASHELRSPLTVINGYLDALVEDEDIPERWHGPLGQMQNQAVRMHQIVSEMLELSRVETAGSAEKNTTINMAKLIREVIADFQRTTTSANIDISIESSADLLGNRSDIESVVINLLSNAVRHTSADGKVILTWRANGDGAELVVSDTGIGIDESDIPRLSERFFRVDRGRSRAEGGIGLGLAIVKHVLMRHDAELSISSEVGVGSVFHCIFPAERVQSGGPRLV